MSESEAYKFIDAAIETMRGQRDREREAAKQKRLDDLERIATLPLEERLRRIEEWIYDYKPEYVEPPRFR